MPEWFKNWENTGLIIYDDKNNELKNFKRRGDY